MRSTFGYIILMALGLGVLTELTVRAFFSYQIGPRTMLYGTDWHRNTDETGEINRRQKAFAEPELVRQVEEHETSEDRPDSVDKKGDVKAGYVKYFSNETKTTSDVDTKERLVASINSHGFRGEDFAIEKPDGTIRILTLGASSTFGYYNRDHETYPVQLETMLNSQCTKENVNFEVINFGIPHAMSWHVRALVEAEGFDLNPDAITFYHGRNDSWNMQNYQPKNWREKGYAVLVNRLLSVALLDDLLVGERESLTASSPGLEARARKTGGTYIENIDAILQRARAEDVLMLVANQQAAAATPYPRRAEERAHMRGVTYGAEAKALQDRFDAGEPLGTFEYSFLVHQNMMNMLENWAAENDVPFVDYISALDDRRDLLVSWVHLHPDANTVLAKSLTLPLLSEFCD